MPDPQPTDARTVDITAAKHPTSTQSPTESAAPEAFPASVPGYEILAEVGRGGMGVVYKAHHLRLNRVVALKMILAGSHAGPAELVRFRQEAETVARLQHPNIVQIYEVGAHAGHSYLALEYVEGGSLAQKTAGLPQPPRDAARLVELLARAVEYAHQNGIIHRDLTPGNVLLNADGAPKLTDFGLARRVRDPQGMTATGAIVGTPGYLSPEQARASGSEIGPATDVHGLGAILYYLLTGRPPFQAATVLDTVLQTIEREPVRPAQLQPATPRDLETICLKCLQKELATRYPSAAELADDLRRFLAGEPILARPARQLERTWRWAKRNPAVASLTALAVALLVTVTVVSFVAAVWLKGERDRADQARRDAESAERERRNQLVQAYEVQARAGRMSRRVGQRFDSLEAIRKAVELARELDLPADRFDALRNEAITCMALPDVRLARKWDVTLTNSDQVTFSGNYQRYARISRHGVVSVRRVADDGELYCWTASETDAEWYAFLSADGVHLGIHWWRSGPLKLWRLDGPKPVAALPTLENVVTATLRPDGWQLAVATRDRAVTFYDLVTGQQVRRLELEAAADRLAFHPSAGRLAVAQGGTVHLRDLETGKRLGKDMGHPAGVNSLAWHPEGELLAVAANDGKIYLWNPGTCQKTVVLEGCKNGGIGVTFNRTGDVLLSWGWEHVLRFWHPRTGKQLFATPGDMYAPCFSPHDRQIAATIADTSGRWEAGLWDVAILREYRTLVHDPVQGPAPVQRGVSLHPNRRLLAVAMSDGPRIWDLTSERQLAWLPIGDTYSIWFEPSGSLLTSNREALWRWPVIAAPANGSSPRIGPPQRLPIATIGEHISASRDGSVLAVPFGSGAIVVHADRPHQPVRLWPHRNTTLAAASPEGRWVATGGHRSFGVKVWDTASGQLVTELRRELANCSARFSPDGRWLATAGDGCRLWTVDSWQPHLHVPTAGLPAFTTDGRLMVAQMSQGLLALIDPVTGREYGRLEDPNLEDNGGYVFTPDGTHVVTSSGGDNGYLIHVWNLRLIRHQLAELGLDWDLPPYLPPPAEPSAPSAAPNQMQVVGLELATDPVKWKEHERAHTLLKLTANAFDAAAHARLGALQLQDSHFAQAFAHLSAAVTLQPDHLAARQDRARAAWRLSRWAEVVTDADGVLRQQANQPNARFLRGQAYQKLGRHTEAVADFTALLLVYAQDPNLYELRANSYEALAKKAEAAADRRKALEVSKPNDLNTRAWRLVTGWAGGRDPARALELITQAIQKEPNNASYLNTLGVVQYRLGRYQEAVATLEKSLAAGAGQAEAFDLFFLAMCHQRLGDARKANDCFDRSRAWWHQHNELPPQDVAELKAFQAEAETELKRLPRIPE